MKIKDLKSFEELTKSEASKVAGGRCAHPSVGNGPSRPPRIAPPGTHPSVGNGPSRPPRL